MRIGDKVIGIKDTGFYGMCKFTKGKVYTIIDFNDWRVTLYDDDRVLTYYLMEYFPNSFCSIRKDRKLKLEKLNENR